MVDGSLGFWRSAFEADLCHMPVSTKASYVGAPVPRQEDDRLLRGAAVFIDDLPEPPGTVFLAFLRSPHPHARIKQIDVSKARAARGVVAVFTGEHIRASTEPMASPTVKGQPSLIRPNMALDVVRYVGEGVAVIAAENPYLAEDAIELIDVEYEQLPAVFAADDALAPNAPLVHDYLPNNCVFNLTFAVPGTDQVFAQAYHIEADRFVSQRISHVAMETRGFLTTYDRGTNKLKHYSTAQLPHKMRWELANTLRLPEKNVQVIAPHVGGSFGMKTLTFPEDVVGAAIARELGRPVKWLQDRQDDLAVMHGRDFQFDVRLALDKDGIILGVKNNVVVNIGAYPLWMTTAGLDAGGAGHHMMGPYRIKQYAYDVSSVVTHKAPTGSYRGVAAPICAFATESLLERAAAKLGLDLIEIRRRNLIQPEDLPFVNAVGITHDTASHLACLDRALALVGYEDFKREQSGKLGPDGKYRGIGIACITDHTGQGTSISRSRGQASRWPGYDGATIRMEPDGKVIAYVSFASQGQGHSTVFAQIIADQLGMPIEDITVEQGDTATMPFGTGAGASRAAVAGGGAVIKASTQIANKLRRIAGHLLEVSTDDIELANGKACVVGADLSVEIKALAETAYMIGPGQLPEGETIGIDATEYFDPPTSSYSNATHAACVAVDSETGRATVERYVVVHDCGRVLNPMIVDGQVVGAIVQGIGSVLTEAMHYSEEGQPLATTLLDYMIPTFLDVPNIEVSHIESPSTTNPGGMKGAGEGGVTGAVPTIVLALRDALSRFSPNFTKLPILPGALVELMTAVVGNN
jgi:aerobic carbon-monoxide dehydrogenase large subunit